MKRYLKDLEAELRKLNLSEEDIFEILEDHKEMILSAQEEGLSDDELESKFGDPVKVASDLVGNQPFVTEVETTLGEGELEGYTLVENFNIVGNIEELKDVEIALVSEDLIYFPYDGESIEVYAKGKFEREDYDISFVSNTFTLKRKGKKKSWSFNLKTPDFGVRVPSTLLKTFDLSLVSGDATIEKVNAKKIDVKSTSGDIQLTNITTPKDLKLSLVSGDAKLNGVNALNLIVSSVSGDVEIAKTSLEEELNVNVVSGDANVTNIQTPEVVFKSVSGDFQGSEVYCDGITFKSVSGDFNINNNNKDHKIEIRKKKTLSGNVTIN